MYSLIRGFSVTLFVIAMPFIRFCYVQFDTNNINGILESHYRANTKLYKLNIKAI